MDKDVIELLIDEIKQNAMHISEIEPDKLYRTLLPNGTIDETYGVEIIRANAENIGLYLVDELTDKLKDRGLINS